MHDPPVLPRTVHPRKPVTVGPTPIIVITDTIIYIERVQRHYPPGDLFPILRGEPSSLVVTVGMARLLYHLHAHFKTDPRWQFAVTPLARERYAANRTATGIVTHDTLVNFFGWKGRALPDGPRGGRRREANHYHITLDPISFAGRGVTELLGTTGNDCDLLYEWACHVRDFCRTNQLRIRPTTGGLAGQLLRDSRFYPDARRKVPAVTNAKARHHLPGNHYRLHVEEEQELEAYYLDQRAAHHNCAATLHFPCANRLYAYGNYRKESGRGGIPPKLMDRALSFYGLFELEVVVPHLPHGAFPPPWAERAGERTIWVYSNELPLLTELKISIRRIVQAHISPHRDTGLNTYALWALDQLSQNPPPKPWVKPVLLASYGILASRPRIHRTGFAQASAGTRQYYPAGAGHLPVIERATEFPNEPAYANVIHRGMIEAESRQRSLRLARDLHKTGYHIIAVYADSVFVNARDKHGDNVPLPLLPPGWEIESELTRLRFHNAVSFTSDQLTKLPGVPGRTVALRSSRGTQHFRSRSSDASSRLAGARGQPAPRT